MGSPGGYDGEEVTSAGEYLVRFAALMTTENRAFDRGGVGGVFGSKNVKVITFDGKSTPDVEIPAEQMEIHREAATDDHIMKRQGTVSVIDLTNEIKGLPRDRACRTA